MYKRTRVCMQCKYAFRVELRDQYYCNVCREKRKEIKKRGWSMPTGKMG